MAKKILNISVVIPTMNRPQALASTLGSIYNGNAVPAEVIVVDQSTNENDRLRNEQYLETISVDFCYRYLHLPMPSLTAARNFGFSWCNSEVVVCSDDDVEVYSDTYEIIDQIFMDPHIAMAAAIDDCSGKSVTNIGYLFGTKSFTKRRIGHVTQSIFGRYPNKVYGQIPTQWAMGYFFVIRKSKVNQWRIRWDEKLKGYAYAEDLDFSYCYYQHAVKEGLCCVLDDRLHVRHLVSREYRIPSQEATSKMILHRYYLLYKHNMGKTALILTKWANLGKLLQRIVKNESPKDIILAEKYWRKHKKNIKNGEFGW